MQLQYSVRFQNVTISCNCNFSLYTELFVMIFFYLGIIFTCYILHFVQLILSAVHFAYAILIYDSQR